MSSLFLIFLAGCGLQPTPHNKPKIDMSLPQVQKVRTLSDITSIALEWTPLYTERVKGYYIYRGKEGKKLTRIAKVDDRYSSHYLDKKLTPNTSYVYMVSAFGKDGRESKPSEVAKAKTLPLPEAVPFVDAIDHLPREVKLIWRPHPYPKISQYIIYRSEPGEKDWKEIAKVNGRLNAEYIDKNLKDKHVYLYKIVARTCDGLDTPPSKIVQASTKPRPSIVRGLQASKNLPKKIIVKWQPNPEPDITMYKIYKSVFEIGPYIVVAKTKNTQYVDLINQDGVKRYYKVTAVDKDGLESFKQDVPAVGTTLAKPLPPVILSKNINGNTISFSWESPDHRAVKYEIVKKVYEGIFDVKKYKFTNITNTTFSDTLVPGIEYEYKIYAIDANGIKSKASEPIKIKLPKE